MAALALGTGHLLVAAGANPEMIPDEIVAATQILARKLCQTFHNIRRRLSPLCAFHTEESVKIVRKVNYKAIPVFTHQ